eukprot:gnl/Chilomastix_cuspidata/4981.p1 GENE.gnl/Chilomastix_cuspidata/4981~~gnl/Chilomastix_cuspidata/4981.p1  ORF type:complete len:344 (+),score=160.41 gnl/Chilomastix_cuspidata/4981:327-1358(+)
MYHQLLEAQGRGLPRSWRFMAGLEGVPTHVFTTEFEFGQSPNIIMATDRIEPSQGVFYFEFDIADVSLGTLQVSVGFNTNAESLSRPGWSRDSTGYYSYDGKIYSDSQARDYHSKFTEGDRVGMLLNFAEPACHFTLNGVLLAPLKIARTAHFLLLGGRGKCSIRIVPLDEFLFPIDAVVSAVFSRLQARFPPVTVPSARLRPLVVALARQSGETREDWRLAALQYLADGQTEAAVQLILSQRLEAPEHAPEPQSARMFQGFPVKPSMPLPDPIELLACGSDADARRALQELETPMHALLSANPSPLALCFSHLLRVLLQCRKGLPCADMWIEYAARRLRGEK